MAEKSCTCVEEAEPSSHCSLYTPMLMPHVVWSALIPRMSLCQPLLRYRRATLVNEPADPAITALSFPGFLGAWPVRQPAERLQLYTWAPYCSSRRPGNQWQQQ